MKVSTLLALPALLVAMLLLLLLLLGAPALAQDSSKQNTLYQGSYFQPPAAPDHRPTAQETCDAFAQNVDGSWTPRHVITVYTDSGNSATVNPGQTFTDGITYSGIDIAGMLEKTCLK